MTLLLVTAHVCLTLASAQGPSWKVTSIQSDLECKKSAVTALAQGNYTGCAPTEIYKTIANVGTCTPCSAQPLGPGFFCEDNQAVLCPNGYYCPDYLEKKICPEGKWCRSGFTQPEDCRVMVSCPKGSTQQKAGLGLIICLLLLVALCCCLSCCIKIRAVKEEERMRYEAEKIRSSSTLDIGDAFSHDTPPVSLEFEDLSMHLKADNKCVLSGITGKFPAKSLVAVMGPSGGGKTTFMNALCGRASYGNVTGNIKINGRDGGVQDFPKLVGFVPQDDIMHADLTVEQNLYYNGLLRLPRGTSKEDILAHVSKVVAALGLEHIAHNVVGDPEKRGISGGQKKRVNIGMELVAMPAIIFMDEPTSGLDGAATVELAQCLSKLRVSGITIICVIHQPRWAVFNEFTHLLLLGSGGKMVYCGETCQMDAYFKSLFFRLPPRENPADWMIDIVCGLVPRYRNSSHDALEDESFTAPDDLFKIWDTTYKGRDTAWDGPDGPTVEPLKTDRCTPGKPYQTLIFLTRNARQWSRSYFVSTCCILFACGTVFGSLMRSLAVFSYAGIMQILTGNGFIFFMICTINARSVFGFERLQYMREFAAGTSCVAYWLAKVLWNIIDVFMYALAFSVPLYWTMPIPAQGYGSFLLMFILAAWYHSGLGIMFSVVFPNPTTSLLLSVFCPMILQIAFSGGLIKISNMNAAQKALSVLSCGRWFNTELYVREMQNYPAHTLNFPAVTETFQAYEIDGTNDHDAGIYWLIFWGLFFRLWSLAVLCLLKYSEGQNCAGRMFNLVSKQLSRIGIRVHGPKPKDTIATEPVYSRQPSVHSARPEVQVGQVMATTTSEVEQLRSSEAV